MLTQYRMTLESDRPMRFAPEWGYRLYSALLERGPASFAERVHTDGITPVSQFLTPGSRPVWTVNLLGEACERELGLLLEDISRLSLERDGVQLRIAEKTCRRIGDVDELFAAAESLADGCRLRVCTPAAFKSRGRYQTLPTPELVIQNLVRKWNGCITECPIEDTDGEGVAALADGLRWKSFDLHSEHYRLKGNAIPGFVGMLAVERESDGFHGQLTDALLMFSSYRGLGIKTALGMGGIRLE